MTVRLTAAQARALGVEAKGKVRRRTTVKGEPYHTICTTCRTEFHTQAAEDRHLVDTRHARFELVLGL